MTRVRCGWRVYGAGIAALGAVCLLASDFVVAQPLPRDFPARAALAYATAAFLFLSGAAIQWPRATSRAAAAIAVFYALAILGSDVPAVLANLGVYGIYSGAAEQVAILAAASIVWAASAEIDRTTAAGLTRASQVAFGLCAVLFGGAHFAYMNLTAPLVPKFLPPSQEFWGVATGIAHIAAGLAILARVRARLAAILLTAMYASFTPLVHLPMLIARPHDPWIWAENAINLALTGAAWVVANSLGRRGE